MTVPSQTPCASLHHLLSFHWDVSISSRFFSSLPSPLPQPIPTTPRSGVLPLDRIHGNLGMRQDPPVLGMAPHPPLPTISQSKFVLFSAWLSCSQHDSHSSPVLLQTAPLSSLEAPNCGAAVAIPPGIALGVMFPPSLTPAPLTSFPTHCFPFPETPPFCSCLGKAPVGTEPSFPSLCLHLHLPALMNEFFPSFS